MQQAAWTSFLPSLLPSFLLPFLSSSLCSHPSLRALIFSGVFFPQTETLRWSEQNRTRGLELNGKHHYSQKRTEASRAVSVAGGWEEGELRGRDESRDTQWNSEGGGGGSGDGSHVQSAQGFFFSVFVLVASLCPPPLSPSSFSPSLASSPPPPPPPRLDSESKCWRGCEPLRSN